VAWVREHADLCALIHGHEWGGVLGGLSTVGHFRRLPPGARTVVVPHGGHVWSLQWKAARALSVEPLRIDHQARITPPQPAAARTAAACSHMHARTLVKEFYGQHALRQAHARSSLVLCVLRESAQRHDCGLGCTARRMEATRGGVSRRWRL
jgi:hypothetical protein